MTPDSLERAGRSVLVSLRRPRGRGWSQTGAGGAKAWIAPAISRPPSTSPIPARYVTGLPATPYRRDGLQPIIAMQCGPVRHTIPAGAIRHEHDLDLRVIRRDTEFDANVLPREASIQEIDGALAVDNDRLRLVGADALDLLGDRRAVMILTERRDHLERTRRSTPRRRDKSRRAPWQRSDHGQTRCATQSRRASPKPSQDSYLPPAAHG